MDIIFTHGLQMGGWAGGNGLLSTCVWADCMIKLESRCTSSLDHSRTAYLDELGAIDRQVFPFANIIFMAFINLR